MWCWRCQLAMIPSMLLCVLRWGRPCVVCMQAMVPRLAMPCLAMAPQPASQGTDHQLASQGMDPQQVSGSLPSV